MDPSGPFGSYEVKDKWTKFYSREGEDSARSDRKAGSNGRIPLLPLLIFYFGIEFTVLLLVWRGLVSLAECKILDILGLKS